jgi:hypothetical protein
MTCAEFERVLPELEGRHDLEAIERDEHLRSCPACLALLTELKAISEQARQLQSSEQPSPRVWNSIEIALRLEGLIREPQPAPARLALPRWKPVWLVPIAALLLVGSGVLVRQHGKSQTLQAAGNSADGTRPGARTSAGDEEQFVRLLASASPAVRAAYQSDLKAVDEYVRDAEESARQNPNDEVAQEYLRGAYDQRSMVYEMALNRLP